ncbi:hypothetical protein DL96DRAFT_234678 [Flagelloscypha sp. PMI_526]|nr:hypothetical protein DL96DRAFT_234678 [Flagelloscypha sp. PMI_526]
MASTLNLSPSLPTELEHYIFILAASTCDQTALARFRLVSREVKEWFDSYLLPWKSFPYAVFRIEPLRFRCLILTNKTWEHFRQLLNRQSKQSLMTVRHIWRKSTSRVDGDIISRCTSITTLCHCNPDTQIFPQLESFSSLRYLDLTDETAGGAFALLQPGVGLRLPPSLTHIRVHAPFDSTTWMYSMQISMPHMPFVTHFMTSYYPHGYPLGIWQILRSLVLDEGVKMLVFLKHPSVFLEGEDWDDEVLEPMDDDVGKSPKVVWVEVGGDWTLKEDWKRRCRGDMDAWDEAELIAQNRGH